MVMVPVVGLPDNDQSRGSAPESESAVGLIVGNVCLQFVRLAHRSHAENDQSRAQHVYLNR